jgi:hypothetical protein
MLSAVVSALISEVSDFGITTTARIPSKRMTLMTSIRENPVSLLTYR